MTHFSENIYWRMKIFTVTVSGGKEVSRLTFSGGLQQLTGNTDTVAVTLQFQREMYSSDLGRTSKS